MCMMPRGSTLMIPHVRSAMERFPSVPNAKPLGSESRASVAALPSPEQPALPSPTIVPIVPIVPRNAPSAGLNSIWMRECLSDGCLVVFWAGRSESFREVAQAGTGALIPNPSATAGFRSFQMKPSYQKCRMPIEYTMMSYDRPGIAC